MKRWGLALMLVLAGCASIGPAREYRVKPGDRLKVVILGELDEQVVVRSDHKISLPVIGEVSTRTQTPAALSETLTSRYRMPTVVMVQESRTWRQPLKEALALARDVLLIALAAERMEGP